jgi:hypothetical protein
MSKSLFDESSNFPSEAPPLQPAQRRPLSPAERAPVQPAAPATVQPVPPPLVAPARRVETKTRADSLAQSSAQRVRDQFRTRFHRQLLLIAIMLPAIWAARLDSRDSHSPLEIVGLAVLFVGFALTLINWRCPSCNRYLYRRIYPASCPRCGVTFHD